MFVTSIIAIKSKLPTSSTLRSFHNTSGKKIVLTSHLVTEAAFLGRLPVKGLVLNLRQLEGAPAKGVRR
jgi:hypothetical protein